MNQQYDVCPHCSGEIKVDATSCRHCGSSDADGWSEPTDGGWDDSDEFDYDDYVRQNHADEDSPAGIQWTALPPLWRWTAVAILSLIALYFMLSLR